MITSTSTTGSTGNTDAPTVGLTAHEVTALVEADRIAFTYYQGVASIRAILREERDRVNGTLFPPEELFPDVDGITHERSVTIIVQGGVGGYDHDGPVWSHHTEPDVSCMVPVTFARTDKEWQTIARSLCPGDQVWLGWLADNNTDTIRQAGLHTDELHLYVDHGDKRTSSYLVRVLTHRDDVARMIRRYGR